MNFRKQYAIVVYVQAPFVQRDRKQIHLYLIELKTYEMIIISHNKWH